MSTLTEVSFVGKWKASTDGETLLQFLATEVADLSTIQTSAGDWLSGVSRSQSLAGFINGIVILHVFGRLLQAAKSYRTKFVDDENKCISTIEAFLVDKLNITRATCPKFAEIAPLALNAARASNENNHKVPPGIRKDVQREFSGCFQCYSCGAILDPLARRKEVPHPEKPWKLIPNGRFAEYEHIWPHSFGGNTVKDNIAPVCLPCNDAKENSISWEWTLVQSMIPTADVGRKVLDPKHTSRAIKMSLHMRAAMMYARKHGTTLKDALRTIGHREKMVSVIDTDDTPDFFNLRVHDDRRTGIQWEA